MFRKGGDVTFPGGGTVLGVQSPRRLFQEGQVPPSLVAEIGDVIERHLKMIGLIPTEALDEHQQRFIEQKRREAESRAVTRENCDGGEAPAFPAEAHLCIKCSMKAVVKMDGCMTCP